MEKRIRKAWRRQIVLHRAMAKAIVVGLLAAVSLAGERPRDLGESARALYRGEYGRAVSLAAEFARAHPQDPAAPILLARARIAQGDFQSAYAELRKALRLAPANLDALYYLGQLSLILSEFEYRQLHALAPESARVHQLLAESYQAQENTGKAKEEYQAALKADPNSVEVLNALGDLERHQFRFDQALSYYSRAAQLQPRNYDSVYGLGASYLYRGEARRAIEFFRRALNIDPSSAVARFALGDALLRVGQPAAAVRELKAAATLEPNLRQAYILLARAYRQLGQANEAQEALRVSEELTRRERDSQRKALAGESSGKQAPAAPRPDSGSKARQP